MDTITCPNCNNTLSENETVCENCGWNAADADVGKKVSTKVVSGEKLSKADLEAFNEGEAVLEFLPETPDDGDAEKGKNKKKDTALGKRDKHNKSVKDIKEDVHNFIKHGIGNIDGTEAPLNEGVFSFQNLDAPESAPTGAKKIDPKSLGLGTPPPPPKPQGEELDLSVFDEIAEKSKKIRLKRAPKSPKKSPKTKAEKEAGEHSGFTKTFASVFVKLCITILSSAVAFLLGFFISDFYHSNMYIDRTYDLASNSVNAVLTKVPKENDFFIQRIFVKPGKEIEECIIFATIGVSEGEYYTTNYRLVIDVENPDKTVLYYAFDEKRYEELKNGTPEEAVTASVMMSHYDSFKRSLSEIAAGKNGWKEANAAYINLMLQEKKK